MWTGPQSQLLGSQVPHSGKEKALVVLPPVVEGMRYCEGHKGIVSTAFLSVYVAGQGTSSGGVSFR
jgi:hypothetical protein